MSFQVIKESYEELEAIQRLHTAAWPASSEFRWHNIFPLIKHSEYQLTSLRIHIWKDEETKVYFINFSLDSQSNCTKI